MNGKVANYGVEGTKYGIGFGSARYRDLLNK